MGLGELQDDAGECEAGNPSSKTSLIWVSTRDLVPDAGMPGKNIGRLWVD